VVKNAMPTDLAALHAAWIDTNPGKAARLGELVLEAVRMFRAAVAANPVNVLDAETDTVPTTGYWHALNWVIFNVAMEMGAPLSPEAYQAVTRADVYLRLVANGGIPVGYPETGSPSYEAPEEDRRVLI
jgi:hypothetical protein